MKRLLPIPFLFTAGAALASEAGAGAHGGIPWGDVLKQAVNFAILAGVLVYVLRKPLSSFLKERSELLRKSIEEAAQARAEAAAKLKSIEERVAGLAGEIEQMNRRAASEAAEETQKIRDAATAEIGRIDAQAKFSAEQEVKKARVELRREAAELSARAAGEIVAKAMTPEDQERLVRENIEKIRGIVK